ncbi:hypothetical protein KCP69_18925 [Salmonella enterica subsp. enterica]|nr:hypothetical protein KCP69_18925 [Salmonella enterica subsp. enterica]
MALRAATPAPNWLLMMDHVVKMTETGGEFRQRLCRPSWISIRIYGFFGCHFIGDPVMLTRLSWVCQDAMWQWWDSTGWLGGEGKAALWAWAKSLPARFCRRREEVTYRIHFKRNKPSPDHGHGGR